MADELQFLDDAGTPKLLVFDEATSKLTADPACCCGRIGFDLDPWPITSCYPGVSSIANLATHISRLGECRIVFAGIAGFCGRGLNFAPSDFPAIATYIQNGGRLWFQGEYGQNITEGISGRCLADGDAVNNFFTAIGSSLQWVDDSDTAGLGCRTSDNTCAAGAANIAQGVTPIKIALAAPISGGTSVWLSLNGNVIVAVEQIGNGFVFLTGDCNISFGCSYNNCDFLSRLFTYADADII